MTRTIDRNKSSGLFFTYSDQGKRQIPTPNSENCARSASLPTLRSCGLTAIFFPRRNSMRISRTLFPKALLLCTAFLSAIAVSSVVGETQKNRGGGGGGGGGDDEAPLFQQYRNVKIGM